MLNYNYNFFQSKLWYQINEEIYKKPIFEIILNNKKYRGIIKEKRIGPISFRWYQILGVKFEGINNLKTLEKIKRDFSNSFGDIMFQLGFTDILGIFNSKLFKNENTLNFIKNEREKINKNLESLGLVPSFRENMPKATVVIDLTNKNEEDFYKSLSSNARNHYNKAKRKGLIFKIADEEEWLNFYKLRHNTAKQKGFNIIPFNQYKNLKEFLLTEKKGNLFLTIKNGEIVSGSICLFDGGILIYLYGATNRKFGNVGSHQFLKIEMFKRAKINGFKFVDLLGTPSFIEKQSNLYGVGKFKWSLGGYQIEYRGSYDLVFNELLYKLFKIKYKIK